MAYIQIPAFAKINTLDNDTEFVIVVDGVEYLVTFKTLSDKFGNTPELLQQINAEIEALRAIVDALPTENPAAPIALKIADTPTIDGIYKPTEAGTYPNAGGLVYDPEEGITYFIRTNGVWVKDVTPINFTPTGVVEEGNTQAVSGGEVYDAIVNSKNQETTSLVSNPPNRINFNLIDNKIEINTFVPVRNSGNTYNIPVQEVDLISGAIAGSIILDKLTLEIKIITNNVQLQSNEILLGMYIISNGTLYVSGIDNYTVNGRNPKSNESYGQLLTGLNTVTFNTDDYTVKFEGSNMVVTVERRYLVPDQTITYRPNPTVGRCALFFNKETGEIQPIYPNNIEGTALNKDWLLIATVYSEMSGRLVVNGIANYKILPETSDIIPQVNKFFETGSYASGVDWLQRAIVFVEWYNVPENGSRRFYAVGKSFPFSGNYRTYLGFRENDTNNFIIPTDWSSTFIETEEPSTDFTGIRTYYLRRASDPNVESSYIGRIAINWDEVPNGQRAFEGYTEGANSKFNQFTFTYESGENPEPPSFKDEYLIYETEGLNEYYDSNVTDEYTNDTNPTFPTGLGSTASWYAAWDNLMTLAPAGYITKHTLGTEVPSSGGNRAIYAYEFHPDVFDTRGSTVEPYSPKSLVTLGVHGGEKTSAVAFYVLIKEMLTNWQNNKYLEFLRFNIPFVIIPCCNPSGWDGGSRYNYNGVDLNRNFPIGWSSSSTSGTAPASEIETQYIIDYLNQFEDNVFLGIDFHNFGILPTGDGEGYYMSYNTAPNDLPLVMNIGKTFNSQMSRKYKEKDSRIPQQYELQLGYSRNSGAQGLIRDYLFSLGSYSATFETIGQFPYDLNEKIFSSLSLNFAIEAQANFLRMMIKYCMVDFNSK